jgi:hypothetical protein
MKPTHQQHNDYLSQELVPGVEFAHNSFVAIVAGEHVGKSGSLVGVEDLGDDPVYLVELESGTDALIPQSCLRVHEV